MLHPHELLADDVAGVFAQQVVYVVDRAGGGIFHRHNAVSRLAVRHGGKDLIKRLKMCIRDRYIGKISDLFIQSQTTSFVNPLSVSIPYFAAIGQLQLVDISKIDLNSKIKKFSHSFICGKGYSPPFGGRIAFFLQSVAAIERLLY